ncbi:MAG: hypothetical protein V4676_11100 [Bacteroidota bacterium]
MKLLSTLLLLLALVGRISAQTTEQKIDPVEFFKDESLLEVTMMLDIKKLLSNKMKDGKKFPAHLWVKMHDGTEVVEPISLEVRGKYRKENCDMPPLKINFKSGGAPVLSSLGSLKLVNVCKPSVNDHTEYMLKEYLIYKMYNVLTDKSFRVRLLKIRYADSSGKRKIDEYAFLMEDIKDMAKRNDCVESKKQIKHTEHTNRKQMTKVALFEYMIANLDWSVPAKHNIKVIVPKGDTNALGFAVPYDFDHAGLVHTDYALPPPSINVEQVTDRNYRGFPRQMEELQEAADEFLSHKNNMYKLINDFELLSSNTRKNMISFIDDFYDMITKPNKIKAEFIQNARKD